MVVHDGPSFDMNAVLGDGPVFFERRDGAVRAEFAAAVIVLRGWGEDFDDYRGIQQCVV